jgi:hypothetical protein
VASFGERGIDYSHHGQQAGPYEKSANSSRDFGDQRKVKKTTIPKGNPPYNLHDSPIFLTILNFGRRKIRRM